MGFGGRGCASYGGGLVAIAVLAQSILPFETANFERELRRYCAKIAPYFTLQPLIVAHFLTLSAFYVLSPSQNCGQSLPCFSGGEGAFLRDDCEKLFAADS